MTLLRCDKSNPIHGRRVLLATSTSQAANAGGVAERSQWWISGLLSFLIELDMVCVALPNRIGIWGNARPSTPQTYNQVRFCALCPHQY